jgi:hypothetical protein
MGTEAGKLIKLLLNMENTIFDQVVSKCKETNKIHIKHISGGDDFSIAADDNDFSLTEWDLIIEEKGVLLLNRKDSSSAIFFPVQAILEITST